ncbi:CatB-related O-acetyltransferase [Vibrio cholerae]|uniref:CatB-related O-acetyltransferase n=1 Tax=Vibrionaceae TaxID=641 RepID=UPI000989210F|nr:MULTISPECIES: CatB-related O-acetyltransferase [Vibrionaceae]OOF18197.1 glycosyl transferase family 1 [Salinivibrio sp. IB574]TQQ12991.1 CatB-related O-acetyltransferase [Vibrio cholerae]TXZ95585.1 CatB-related O-acetyltransferase [Vibrio cholerae]BCN18424.1 putative acetyltransferase [Vibrio cholerae]BCN18494.1 putative acetyltransferase [Vibrio cholerae]
MTNLIYYLAKIIKKSRLSAIKSSDIHPSSKIESGSNVVNSSMGKHSFCGYNCEITQTSIGSFCSIANGVIIGGGMHPIDWVSTSPVFYQGRDSVAKKFSTHAREEVKQTTIGHDVWIGQNVLIKQGVTIGTGSVIGMGSVVIKDVEPYTIVAGNPARFIRYRFDKEVIEGLLASLWWDIEESKLEQLAQDIKSPLTFINKLKNEEKSTNRV